MVTVPRTAAPVYLAPAAMLWLKVYALVAMIVDHIDWLLLDSRLGFHDTIGRTVFPIFAFLLAFNLARERSQAHLVTTVGPRMAIVGLIAAWPYSWLTGQILPFNVMLTLALGTFIVAAIRAKLTMPAALLFVIGGLLVDYQWSGLLCIVGAWWLLKEGKAGVLAIPVAMTVVLYPINGNGWALLALPILVAACYTPDVHAPRMKWLFYVAYPTHLAVLAALAAF